MVATGWIHTVHKDGVWQNQIAGGETLSVHRVKDEAVEAGRELAQARATGHLVHNIDGSVSGRSNYDATGAERRP